MKLAQVNEAMDHRITEGSEYQWNCWNNARYLDYESDFAYVSVVYNTKNQSIYQAEVTCKSDAWTVDPKPYRWLNPVFKFDMFNEASMRGTDPNQAWDDVKWVDLETVEDFLKKAKAIFNGEVVDERVEVPLELDNNTLLKLMTMAHERDITLNKMVELVLQEVINKELS